MPRLFGRANAGDLNPDFRPKWNTNSDEEREKRWRRGESSPTSRSSGWVKQLEAGRTAAEMAREIGVSTYTIYSWKAKFGGLEPNEATKLRHLEDENGRLKKLVAELVRCP